MDHFQLLEQKVESLIKTVETLKQGNADLAETLQVREKTLDNLLKESARLKAEKERARQLTGRLMEKLDLALEPVLKKPLSQEKGKGTQGPSTMDATNIYIGKNLSEL
jgi:predicted RNase H-like nuclease (RuvC/YqgF family)